MSLTDGDLTEQRMLEIADVAGREILDSRGDPAVVAEIKLAGGSVSYVGRSAFRHLGAS
jgi:enolase